MIFLIVCLSNYIQIMLKLKYRNTNLWYKNEWSLTFHICYCLVMYSFLSAGFFCIEIYLHSYVVCVWKRGRTHYTHISHLSAVISQVFPIIKKITIIKTNNVPQMDKNTVCSLDENVFVFIWCVLFPYSLSVPWHALYALLDAMTVIDSSGLCNLQWFSLSNRSIIRYSSGCKSWYFSQLIASPATIGNRDQVDEK